MSGADTYPAAGAISPAEAAPQLSILMVNWNTRDMTLACLRSLYAETRDTRIEVILIDNASHDGSADAIATEFPQVRLVRSGTNHGFAKATNMAADLAQSALFLLLNTDTVVLDRAIDKLVAFAAARPAARMWGGRTVFGDRSLNKASCFARITPWSAFCMASGLAAAFKSSALFNPEAYGGWRRDTVREVDIVTGCLLLIERDLWRQLKGFDETFFMYGEEADLCARARAAGARPAITPDTTIVHYGGASARQFADRICYVFGARIGLIQRQFSPGWRGFGRAVTMAGAAWRAGAYGAIARVSRNQRHADSAREWGEAWRRRALWKNGPVARALK